MSQTNYVPQIFSLTFTGSLGSQLSGVGSPEGAVTGYPGYTYINTSNGNFYAFNGTAGANTGWVLVTASASTTQVFAGTGNPNGVVTATSPALYYDTSNSLLYQKTGSGNTGWN